MKSFVILGFLATIALTAPPVKLSPDAGSASDERFNPSITDAPTRQKQRRNESRRQSRAEKNGIIPHLMGLLGKLPSASSEQIKLFPEDGKNTQLGKISLSPIKRLHDGYYSFLNGVVTFVPYEGTERQSGFNVSDHSVRRKSDGGGDSGTFSNGQVDPKGQNLLAKKNEKRDIVQSPKSERRDEPTVNRRPITLHGQPFIDFNPKKKTPPVKLGGLGVPVLKPSSTVDSLTFQPTTAWNVNDVKLNSEKDNYPRVKLDNGTILIPTKLSDNLILYSRSNGEELAELHNRRPASQMERLYKTIPMTQMETLFPGFEKAVRNNFTQVIVQNIFLNFAGVVNTTVTGAAQPSVLKDLLTSVVSLTSPTTTEKVEVEVMTTTLPPQQLLPLSSFDLGPQKHEDDYFYEDDGYPVQSQDKTHAVPQITQTNGPHTLETESGQNSSTISPNSYGWASFLSTGHVSINPLRIQDKAHAVAETAQTKVPINLAPETNQSSTSGPNSHGWPSFLSTDHNDRYPLPTQDRAHAVKETTQTVPFTVYSKPPTTSPNSYDGAISLLSDDHLDYHIRDSVLSLTDQIIRLTPENTANTGPTLSTVGHVASNHTTRTPTAHSDVPLLAVSGKSQSIQQISSEQNEQPGNVDSPPTVPTASTAERTTEAATKESDTLVAPQNADEKYFSIFDNPSQDVRTTFFITSSTSFNDEKASVFTTAPTLLSAPTKYSTVDSDLNTQSHFNPLLGHVKGGPAIEAFAEQKTEVGKGNDGISTNVREKLLTASTEQTTVTVPSSTLTRITQSVNTAHSVATTENHKKKTAFQEQNPLTFVPGVWDQTASPLGQTSLKLTTVASQTPIVIKGSDAVNLLGFLKDYGSHTTGEEEGLRPVENLPDRGTALLISSLVPATTSKTADASGDTGELGLTEPPPNSADTPSDGDDLSHSIQVERPASNHLLDILFSKLTATSTVKTFSTSSVLSSTGTSTQSSITTASPIATVTRSGDRSTKRPAPTGLKNSNKMNMMFMKFMSPNMMKFVNASVAEFRNKTNPSSQPTTTSTHATTSLLSTVNEDDTLENGKQSVFLQIESTSELSAFPTFAPTQTTTVPPVYILSETIINGSTVEKQTSGDKINTGGMPETIKITVPTATQTEKVNQPKPETPISSAASFVQGVTSTVKHHTQSFLEEFPDVMKSQGTLLSILDQLLIGPPPGLLVSTETEDNIALPLTKTPSYTAILSTEFKSEPAFVAQTTTPELSLYSTTTSSEISNKSSNQTSSTAESISANQEQSSVPDKVFVNPTKIEGSVTIHTVSETSQYSTTISPTTPKEASSQATFLASKSPSEQESSINMVFVNTKQEGVSQSLKTTSPTTVYFSASPQVVPFVNKVVAHSQPELVTSPSHAASLATESSYLNPEQKPFTNKVFGNVNPELTNSASQDTSPIIDLSTVNLQQRPFTNTVLGNLESEVVKLQSQATSPTIESSSTSPPDSIPLPSARPEVVTKGSSTEGKPELPTSTSKWMIMGPQRRPIGDKPTAKPTVHNALPWYMTMHLSKKNNSSNGDAAKKASKPQVEAQKDKVSETHSTTTTITSAQTTTNTAAFSTQMVSATAPSTITVKTEKNPSSDEIPRPGLKVTRPPTTLSVTPKFETIPSSLVYDFSLYTKPITTKTTTTSSKPSSTSTDATSSKLGSKVNQEATFSVNLPPTSASPVGPVFFVTDNPRDNPTPVSSQEESSVDEPPLNPNEVSSLRPPSLPTQLNYVEGDSLYSLQDTDTEDDPFEIPEFPTENKFSCLQMTKEKRVSFLSPKYPEPDDVKGSCAMRLFVARKSVCQLRIDFNDVRMLLPRQGFCLDQYLQISGSVKPNGIERYCGRNPDQHFYIELQEAPKSGLPRHIDFTVVTLHSGYLYRYGILIRQIECVRNNRLQAPAGCTQYFTQTSGVIKSFNYEGGQYYNNQGYRICIRNSAGACATAFKAGEGAFGIQKLNSRRVPATRAGVGSKVCIRDYIWLAEGSADLRPDTQSQDRYCGGTFSPFHGDNTSRPVFSPTKNAITALEFRSGVPTKFNANTHGPGFKISYTQVTNCNSFLPEQSNVQRRNSRKTTEKLTEEASPKIINQPVNSEKSESEDYEKDQYFVYDDVGDFASQNYQDYYDEDRGGDYRGTSDNGTITEATYQRTNGSDLERL